MNDPHENATWVYNYDRGGNITSKVKYAYTTGTLGTAQQTIPYVYDTVWKDKLVKYDGKTITYDAIGNPLNDGERKYTWSAGRQLKKVALPATVSESMNTTDGVDAGSNARLKIVFSNSNVLQNASAKTTASAHVYVGTEEITANIPAANFTWVKVAENGTVTSNWKKGVKSVSLTQADLSGATEIRCEVTQTSEYGTVQVDNSMMASHTPAVDDANDKFSIENGNLMLNTTDTENLYKIENNCLKVEAGLGVNLTAKAVVYPKLPDKVVEFKYNVDGLRTQKKVILPNGQMETTKYILHGKLLTEMRKGQDVLHFFYDEQSRPATIKYNGKIYTYVHNLQRDVVGILDSAGSLVVEYKYDAWGKSINEQTLTNEYIKLASLNPFRYRGYVWDRETKLYYLRSRYYNVIVCRFINEDMGVMQLGQLANRNIYSYCDCNPISFSDANGTFKIGNLNIRREDLKNDWMGIKILWWYLFGGGRDRIFKSNKWGNYIKNTKLCQCGKCSGKYPDRTLYQYTIDQLKPYSANLAEGETLKVPTLRMKVAITNGEGIVGYNYLHGVSYDIENGLYGYQVDATITKSNGFTVYRIKSTWHDAIDPNFVYATDRAKASFAQTIPFADPQNYNLIVSWEDIYIENSEGIGLAY